MKEPESRLPFHSVLQVNSELLDPIGHFWETLPTDPYLEEGYRFRALSRFMVGADGLETIPTDRVFQTLENNPRFGDLARKFAPLDQEIVKHREFLALCDVFLEALPVAPEGQVLWVHQIRVTHDQTDSVPVPEGRHRDERDFVGVLVVNMRDVEPDRTELFLDSDSSAFFQTTLGKGEMIVFDDRQMLHTTHPFRNPPSSGAFRDIFIFALTETESQGQVQNAPSK